MMKTFPRLVRPVLSDMLKLYGELGRGSGSKTSTNLRTRLLMLIEASGAEISNASYTSPGKGKKKKSADEEESAQELLIEELERLCLKDGDVEQAKNAIRVLSSLAKKCSDSDKSSPQSPVEASADESPAFETLTRIVSTLSSSKHLKVENKRLLVALHVLREVAKSFPGVFESHSQKVPSPHTLHTPLVIVTEIFILFV